MNKLDKFIQKILDKYFTNKLIEEIKDTALVWNLDVKIKKDKRAFGVYVKKKKYNDSEYVSLIWFYYKEAIMYFMKLDKTKEKVREHIRAYCEKN